MIPPEKILPQDMVDVWDKGPPEPKKPEAGDEVAARVYETQVRDHAEWHARWGDGPGLYRMHVSDARHAIAIEPLRYSVDPPEGHDPATRPMPDQVSTQSQMETAAMADAGVSEASLAEERQAAAAREAAAAKAHDDVKKEAAHEPRHKPEPEHRRKHEPEPKHKGKK